MAPGLNIQSLLNGVTINAQETVMNDKYQVGQAGAVGPVSKARENFFARAWDVQRSQIDLDVLVRELGEVRDKGRALVQGRNDAGSLR